jgi:multidrug transporter EmrE-like cation transporter
MKNIRTKDIFLIFLLIIFIEAIALFCVKYSSESSSRNLFLFTSCLLYALIPLLLYLIVLKTGKIASLNCSWNICSNMYGLAIGVLIFSEVYKSRQILGMLLGVLAIFLMSL